MATISHSERPRLALLPQAPEERPVDDAEADRLYAEALAAARRAGRVAAELERVARRAPDPAWTEAAAACRRAEGALQRAGEAVPSVPLDPVGGAERGVLAVGPLLIDRGPRRALYGGRPLTLTRREFDLLCALCRQAGSVVTKADLMREVWSFQGNAWRTRTLDSHASRLRRALVAAGAPAVTVENIWGVGYRLIVDAAPEPDEAA